MKIIAISDTHNKHNSLKIPECDILIHSGDWSGMGRESETRNFAKWLNKQEAGYIVVVPGNHEVEFEKALPDSLNWILDECPSAHILIDRTIDIEGIKIHGSPVTPWFFDWAWNRSITKDDLVMNPRNGKVKTVPHIKPHWDKIPEGTNILITHGPPYKILDELVFVDGTPKGQFVGCPYLMDRINEIKPDIHIFGHIHCGHGQKHFNGTSFYNVSTCDEMYMPTNGYTEIEYEKDKTNGKNESQSE